MAIASTDLVYYGAANHAEADGTTQGGAIDLTTKVIFTDISATGAVEVLSSSASDVTQTVTITGRNAAGSIVSEVETLAGVAVQLTTATFERILKIVMSATAVGTITIRKASDDVTIATLEPGFTSVRRLFYDSRADASGGSSRDFYEKFFIKNTHGSLSLLTATIQLNADPSTFITFDLEDAVNDNNSTANRLNTAPTGMLGTFTTADKAVPGTNLAAAASIGVWARLRVAAGTAPSKNTFTIRATGGTV